MQQKQMTWLLMSILLVVSAVLFLDTRSQGQVREPFKFPALEYKTIAASNHYDSRLNELGALGWELVTASPVDNSQKQTLFVLKRHKH